MSNLTTDDGIIKATVLNHDDRITWSFEIENNTYKYTFTIQDVLSQTKETWNNLIDQETEQLLINLDYQTYKGTIMRIGPKLFLMYPNTSFVCDMNDTRSMFEELINQSYK